MISIRKATAADAQEIRVLENKTWGEEVVNKYDIPMFVRFGWCFVAKEGKKLVGAICSFPTKDDEVYVCDWAVAKAYRGQSIGLKLYERLIREVKGKTIVTFLDPANIPTVEAHKKLGFKIIGKVKSPYGLKKGIEGDDRILVRLGTDR